MGISSAFNAFRDRVNSTLGSKPAPNMTLNTSGHHISQPVKKSPTGGIVYYDPVVNSAVSKITGSDESNVTKKALESATPKPKPRPRPRPSGGDSGLPAPSRTSAKKSWDYYEAPLAEKYGFGKETAYQEALANTAFRREMNDMRKAGINPSVYYGSHSSSGAESNIYPRDAASGGSSGYGGSGGYSRRSRGGNSGKYAFSGGAYYGIMAAAGTVAAIATHNAGVGMATAGLVGTAMKAINGFLKK